jgi:iron complex transport system substrate-binding protein
MRGVSTLNGLALAAAVAASAALTWSLGVRESQASRAEIEPGSAAFVPDTDGRQVPVRFYDRIVSASTIADQVLLALIEPSRVLAVTNYTLEHGSRPWRYEGKLGIDDARAIETIIELQPDIVFVNAFADVRHVERMKEAGLTVFNLGELRGLETLLSNIEQIAAVLGVRQRGDMLARELERRLAAVAADVPRDAHRRAVYVGMQGDRLFGGTAGTSFHDVLTAAGLIDAAAEAGYTGWPAYTSEQLLELDPPWIITNDRSEEIFCGHPGFERLTACIEGRVRGVDDDVMGDPGLDMLRAAEAVHEAVYHTE